MPGACYVMIKLHRYMWLWRRLIASRGYATGNLICPLSAVSESTRISI